MFIKLKFLEIECKIINNFILLKRKILKIHQRIQRANLKINLVSVIIREVMKKMEIIKVKIIFHEKYL